MGHFRFAVADFLTIMQSRANLRVTQNDLMARECSFFA